MLKPLCSYHKLTMYLSLKIAFPLNYLVAIKIMLTDH